MNKKILLASLGVIALGGAFFLNSGGISSLMSTVITGTPSDNTTAVMNKRYFVSEDGKNMYTLTYNKDGSRKYSVEIPKEYIDTYTDQFGPHEQPIVWPFTDFPREVVSNMALNQEYYSAESVAKWAPVFFKNYSSGNDTNPGPFEKELTEAQ